MDYSWLKDVPGAVCKPEPRKRTKARKVRVRRDRTAEIRAYVFARERDICRCCRMRAAESMHELRPKSLRGRVSRTNSVAVCGDGVRGCHGFLQRHEISFTAGIEGAEGPLLFTPEKLSAAEWLHIGTDKRLLSEPMRSLEVL
jgi:hypothetical protein